MSRSHPVDIHVGTRLRQRRTLLGMSQTKLAESVGLTFQQIQKYERGSNRMGSSRLYEFGKVLDVPISHFFEEMPANVLAAKIKPGRQGAPPERGFDPLIKRETLELVRAYYKIRATSVRKRVSDMVRALGAGTPISRPASKKVRKAA